MTIPDGCALSLVIANAGHFQLRASIPREKEKILNCPRQEAFGLAPVFHCWTEERA